MGNDKSEGYLHMGNGSEWSDAYRKMRELAILDKIGSDDISQRIAMAQMNIGRVGDVKPDLVSMIRSRLRMTPSDQMPFDYLNAQPCANGGVVVFIIHKGEPLMLKDDGGLFPSDQFISQLRLLME